MMSLFGTCMVLAQNGSCDCCLKGKVLDADTNEPIPFATVQVQNSNKYAQTNENAEFIIDGICAESCTLVISCLGYSQITKEHHHVLIGDHPHFYLSQETTGLDEVMVQARGNSEKGTETIAKAIITKADIKYNPTQSLAASLAKVEGVTFASKGANVQLPVIQGLSGNRILVLNNGLKHGFQNWGAEHAPEIDINTANNITVIKGAAGVRYGPEALSGVVLIEPNQLHLNKPIYANLGTSFQTNGRGGNANFEIGKGKKSWSYFLNGSYTKLGDRFATNYDLTNTGKEETAFGFGLRHQINDWDFKVHYSFIDQNLGLLRSSVAESANLFISSINADEPIIIKPFSYDINQPNQLTQHQLAKAEVNWRYSDEAKLKFIAGAQLNRRDEFDVRRNADLPIIDLDLITIDYQLEWEHPDWRGMDGVLGVQYFTQNNDNNPGTLTTPFIPNYNSKRISAFGTEKIKMGEHTLEVGARFDMETNDVRGRETNQDIYRDNYTFTNITASIGYIWQLSEGSNFKTNIGSAFRTPNVAELFSFGQEGFRSIFGLLRLSNDNGQLSTSEVIPLEESSVKLEKGYKWSSEFRFSNSKQAHVLSTYVHYIENFVFDRPLGIFGSVRGPQLAFFYDQADALLLGFDYDWKKEWTKNFSSTFGLSYLWSRNIGENEPLIHQAPISTNLELTWDQGDFWFFESSKFKLKPTYTFRQFQAPRTISPESLVDGSITVTPDSEIFDYTDAPEGYFLLDASWNFKYKKISGSIAAQNLLNSSYRNYLNDFRYFADDLGRNIFITLNYNF